MGHQSPYYLKLKRNTYYYSRRVPKELQKHSKCSRFEVCLRTSAKSVESGGSGINPAKKFLSFIAGYEVPV